MPTQTPPRPGAIAERIALYGTEQPPAERQSFSIGGMTFERVGGRFGAVRVNGHEVWHGFAFLFRDSDWLTPEPRFDRIASTDQGSQRRIRLFGHIPAEHPIELELELTDHGGTTLEVVARATPRGDLSAQRIGLCLLHPLSAAGGAVEIEHVDGRLSRSTLPTRVSPWPPFTLVRQVRHEYRPGHWACARLEGEQFEFEDQRNNADASFKTYSRSNMMPRPFRIAAGETIEQRLTLTIERVALAHAHSTARVSVPDTFQPMPRLGIALDVRDAGRARAVFADLDPAAIHLSLDPGLDPGFAAGSIKALSGLLASTRASVRMDVAGEFDTAALLTLAHSLEAHRIPVESVAVFPGTAARLEALRAAFPRARAGSGTPHFFAQLNRIEGVGKVDFVSFTVCPTVHGSSEDDLIAGLASLPSMIETVRASWPGCAVRVGPSQIGAWRSPLGSQPDSRGAERATLARRDPRSRALFGAVWMLGHVASAIQAGVEAVTVMELYGDAGLVDDEASEARKTPAFYILRELNQWRSAAVSDLGVPGRALAVFGDPHPHRRCLIANLSAEPLRIDGVDFDVLQGMDARSVADTAHGASPWRDLRSDAGGLTLAAYAIVLASVVPTEAQHAAGH